MATRLTVLFDGDCTLCTNARGWMERQAQFVPLEFVPANSAEAHRRYPELNHGRTLEVLHVVDERGQVYRAEKAWLMCLWALKAYRGWSLRLAVPGKIERVEEIVRWISSRRYRFGWVRHAD